MKIKIKANSKSHKQWLNNRFHGFYTKCGSHLFWEFSKGSDLTSIEQYKENKSTFTDFKVIIPIG